MKFSKTSRRAFLKSLGLALGGFCLSSCDSGGNGFVGGGFSGNPLLFPGGYIFSRFVREGDPLPGGGVIADFSGAVIIHDNSEVVFAAEDETGNEGIYRAYFDRSAFAPQRATDIRKVLRQGDVLPDGRTVERIGQFAANLHHSIAVILETSHPTEGEELAGIQTRIYFSEAMGPFLPLLEPLTDLPDGQGKFGLRFGDLDLHEDDDLLVVANYSDDTAFPKEGLFFIPGAHHPSGEKLFSSRDLVPDADGTISGIGLVDLSDDSNFVCQVRTETAASLRARGGAGNTPTAVVAGRARDRGSISLRGAPKGLDVSPAVRSRGGFLEGDSIYGPRVGRTGEVAQIVHVDDEELILAVGEQELFRAGGTLSSDEVSSMWGPVLGRNGLLYICLHSEERQDLVASDGQSFRTYLSQDDDVDGLTIDSIGFGFMPKQVDKDGVMAFYGDFADNTAAVVLGLPT